MTDDGPDLGALRLENNHGYGTWPLPCPRDGEIADLLPSLLGGAAGLRDGGAQVLLAFAERMASLARVERSVDRLRRGLDAAGLAISAPDAREALLVLPLLWRTAAVLGLDPTAEFVTAATRAGGAGALVDFAGREPGDQAIEAMGYVEAEDERGFRYRRTW